MMHQPRGSDHAACAASLLLLVACCANGGICAEEKEMENPIFRWTAQKPAKAADAGQPHRLTRYLVKRLESLGHEVTLAPVDQAA